MAKKLVEWREANLKSHYDRHPASEKHKACWCNLTGHDPDLGSITIFKYEDESLEVVENRWLEYEAKWLYKYNVPEEHRYEPQSNYYVDDRMVITITINDDKTNKEYIKTCYDHHFSPEGYIKKNERKKMLRGELQDRYLKNLKDLESCRKIKPGSLRVIHDESN
tara:strand:+ start:11720 stop:12214 length:495 start_codon:yes stop_codon:yes gene_type:complete